MDEIESSAEENPWVSPRCVDGEHSRGAPGGAIAWCRSEQGFVWLMAISALLPPLALVVTAIALSGPTFSRRVVGDDQPGDAAGPLLLVVALGLTWSVAMGGAAVWLVLGGQAMEVLRLSLVP